MKPRVPVVSIPPTPAIKDPNDNITNHLVQSLGVVLLASSVPILIGLLNKKFISPNQKMYRVFWVVAFVVNLVTVQIPGRFDSQVSAAGKTDKFPWRTMFSPSGWAFSIWAVIYLSELLVSGYIGAIGNPVEAIRKATPFWVAGNLFQSFWCFTFRPSFLKQLWVPASQLFLGAISMNLLHHSLTESISHQTDLWQKIILMLIRFPIALHGSWLTAATLLNTNSWISYSKASLTSQYTFATASAYLGGLVGGYITLKRRDPFVGLTFAWALAALADRTKNNPEVELPPVATESLALTERILSTSLIVIAAIAPFLDQISNIVYMIADSSSDSFKKIF